MGDINSLFSTTGITDSDRILHTPGEFARKNLLYVQEVGKLKSLQPHKSQRERIDISHPYSPFISFPANNPKSPSLFESTIFSVSIL